jgi:uracil-DNA glycosylase family 4
MQRLFPENPFVAPKMPDPKKDLLRILVAEAPGETESEQGEPLVGGSGRLARKLYAKAGIDFDGLTLANCIQCRPPKNIFPTDPAGRSYISKLEAIQAVQHCKKAHVEPLLASRKWHRVDLLGDKPLSIIGGVSGGIGTWRGSPISISPNLRGIATYHPSYLMRDQSMLPVAVNDLMKSLEEPPEWYSPWANLDEVKQFKFKKFAFDIECTQYKVLGPSAPADLVGLCARPGFAICVPVKGPYIPELRRIFLEAEELIGHNALQFDCPKLFKQLDLEWQ